MIIGSYTGRNAGDCAILENVTKGIVEACPGAQCEVLTTNPGFVRSTYPSLPLKPVRTLPWDFSVKFLGVPLLRAVARADAVVITAAMFFDIKFWNPLYNYLTTLLTAVGFAKLLRKKIIYYGVGVGPLYTWKGKASVRWLLAQADAISLREDASEKVIKAIGSDAPFVLAADPAINQVFDEPLAKMSSLLREKLGSAPRVAINLNAYIDTWTGDRAGVLSQNDFIEHLVEVGKRLSKDWDYSLVLVCTQYMDESVMEEVVKRLQGEARLIFLKNREYNHRELMAAMSLCDFMIGMRLHCQILSCAAGTPCLALNYAPKVRNFMEMAGLADYTVDFDEQFGADKIMERATHLREHLEEIRSNLRERANVLKAQEKQSVRVLRELMHST